MTVVDRTAQTLTLRDGRRLGYAEWGDLDGVPVFFFGGSGNARFMRFPDDSIITQIGIHLYTFDRPGMGMSTRQTERRLLNWAEDIRDFSQQKGISRFAIIAISQGGPYGLACAYALHNRTMQENARALGEKIRAEDGLAEAVKWVERFLTQ